MPRPARDRSHPTTATLADAIRIAAHAHRNQKDKAGQPYILHPLRVMFACETDVERIVGVLHDVLEDTPCTPADLRRVGFGDDVLAALDCVTKRRGERYDAFLGRVASNTVARQVKLMDLEDNLDVRRLMRIQPKDVKRLNRYLRAWKRLRASSGRGRTVSASGRS